MPIKFRCPCRQVLRVPSKQVGEVVECPNCKASIRVPGAVPGVEEPLDHLPKPPPPSSSAAPPLPPATLYPDDNLQNLPAPDYLQQKAPPPKKIYDRESAATKITTFGIVLTTALLAFALIFFLIVLPKIQENMEIKKMLDDSPKEEVSSDLEDESEEDIDAVTPKVIPNSSSDLRIE